MNLDSSYVSSGSDPESNPDVPIIQTQRPRAPRIVSSSATELATDQERAWLVFLNESKRAGRFSDKQIVLARELFASLRAVQKEVPVTGPTESGSLQMYWDTGSRYLEIEILVDATLQWFFRDRQSELTAGTERPIAALGSDFAKYLKMMTRR